MRTKSKILLSSALAIIVCISMIVGATLAIFVKSSESNFVIQTAKVKVRADIDKENVMVKSGDGDYDYAVQYGEDEFYFDDTLEKSIIFDGENVKLTNIAINDYAKFDMKLTNESTIGVMYRVGIRLDNSPIADVLEVRLTDNNGKEWLNSVDGYAAVTTWQAMDGGLLSFSVEIGIPERYADAFNALSDIAELKPCQMTVAVEAVQSNAKIDEYEDTTVPDGAYIVSNASDLQALAAMTDLPDKVFLLRDIDLGSIDNWTPINNFTGDFDGNNKKISNLTVNRPNEDNVGLFGKCFQTNMYVHDLIVDGAYVSGRQNVGVIAGSVAVTGFENVTVQNSEVVTSWKAAGGITGSAYADFYNCKVLNTIVSTTYDKDDEEGDDIGGITGLLNENEFDIIGCVIDGVTVSGKRDVGGLAGTAWGDTATIINNRISNLTVTHTLTDGFATAGALVGRNGGGSRTEYDDVFDTVSNIIGEKVIVNGKTIGAFTAATAFPTPPAVDDVYTIDSVSDMLWFADYVAAGNTDVNVKLGKDINLAAVDWEPIDNFNGEFNGNGRTIYNLTVNKAGVDNVGLFGLAGTNANTGNAYIHSFTVDGASITGANYSAVIVGKIYSSRGVQNVTVKNAIVNANTIGANCVGGIVGGGDVNISNSAVYDSQIIATADLVGGIIGEMSKEGAWRIAECTVDGVAIVGGEYSSSIAGIAGWALDNVTVTNNTVSNTKIFGNKYNSDKMVNTIVGTDNDNDGNYYSHSGVHDTKNTTGENVYINDELQPQSSVQG